MARLPPNCERHFAFRESYLVYDKHGYAFRARKAEGRWSASPVHGQAKHDTRRFSASKLADLCREVWNSQMGPLP